MPTATGQTARDDLTLAQAAEIFGVHYMSIWRRARRRIFEGQYRLEDGEYRIPTSTVLRILENGGKLPAMRAGGVRHD